MLFNSYEFIFLFLPGALLGYWLMARYVGFSASLWWLVAASLFFYGWWKPVYLPLLVASVLVNYGIGRLLSRPIMGRRLIATLGIALNLGALLYYKYTNYVLGSVDSLMGTAYNPPDIVLPLAISFFTFQQIAYLVDSYRGLTHEYSLSRYALFVTFFPQLIAGPIVHHGHIIPQLEAQGRWTPRARQLLLGLTIFSAGLFKKIVLADSISVYANQVFGAAAQGESLDLFLSWTGALCYTLQLYFDFSGYSDMAIGLALLVGMRLPLNFDSPLKSGSISELWRRWHITLTRFMRDYVYIPLGGNRKGPLRAYFNAFFTMFLSGIWHGAGTTFVIWGAYHGLLVAINNAWARLRVRLGWERERLWWDRIGAKALTLLAWIVGMVMFRADSMDTAMRLLAGMFGLHGAHLPLHWQSALHPVAPMLEAAHIGFANAALMLTYAPLLWIAVLSVIALSAPNLYQMLAREKPVLRDDTADPTRWHWAPTWPWVLATAGLAALALANMSNISQFLYFQF